MTHYTFELKATTQKSYYNKAIVHVIGDTYYLQSYNTIVCSYKNNGGFLKFWCGYSVTTMNHINDFRKLFDLSTLSKKEWSNIQTSVCYSASDLLNNNYHIMNEKMYNNYLSEFSKIKTTNKQTDFCNNF